MKLFIGLLGICIGVFLAGCIQQGVLPGSELASHVVDGRLYYVTLGEVSGYQLQVWHVLNTTGEPLVERGVRYWVTFDTPLAADHGSVIQALIQVNGPSPLCNVSNQPYYQWKILEWSLVQPAAGAAE